MLTLTTEIAACELCRQDFADTHSQHAPRPVVWLSEKSQVLICGQAPGARVHASGKPFDDPSGDRLRDWLGVDKIVFYDTDKFAFLPMAFCFPGYNAKKSDLPPPKRCSQTWHGQVFDSLRHVEFTILLGGYAQDWYFGKKKSLTDRLATWETYAPNVAVLPHPSWRNNTFLKRNPVVERDIVPFIQAQIKSVLV